MLKNYTTTSTSDLLQTTAALHQRWWQGRSNGSVQMEVRMSLKGLSVFFFLSSLSVFACVRLVRNKRVASRSMMSSLRFRSRKRIAEQRCSLQPMYEFSFFFSRLYTELNFRVKYSLTMSQRFANGLLEDYMRKEKQQDCRVCHKASFLVLLLLLFLSFFLSKDHSGTVTSSSGIAPESSPTVQLQFSMQSGVRIRGLQSGHQK